MDRRCYLCKSKERDEVKYGEFMTRQGISVHYFCLLLTSNLLQRGHDDQGFLGFLLPDIKAEAERVESAVCCYCKEKSANISCCAPKCRKTFHLTCGIKNDAESQFVGTFKSYCSRHVTGKKNRSPQRHEPCCICYEDIMGDCSRFNCVTMLRAPCCKNGWFHKWCLAAFAQTAGYFFKCPLCNDDKVFRQRLVYKGIFIPDRDAAWELEPNAYAELLERPKTCSAMVCKARGGRTSKCKRNELDLCGTCGSVAIHRLCKIEQDKGFHCPDCVSIMTGVNDSSVVNISASQQTCSDEDEDIDVCEDVVITAQIQDSDEDEGAIRPLGMLKKSGHMIFDDEMSDNGGSHEDEDVRRHRGHKKINRLLSSDIEEFVSVNPKRERTASQDTGSLFDSGTETDRSGSGGDKFNTKNKLEAPTTNGNLNLEKEEKRGNHIKLNPTENLRETKKGSSRFKPLSDGCSDNEYITRRTRRQSLGVEFMKSYEFDENGRCPSITLRRRSARNSEPKIGKAEITANLNRTVSQLKKEYCDKVKISSNVNNLAASRLNYENEQPREPLLSRSTRLRSLNMHIESPNSYLRPRTISEDPSKASPALRRSRRRSFLQSPYSSPVQQDLSRPRSTNLLNSGSNKRSRSESRQSDEVDQNKRHKNSYPSDENIKESSGSDTIHKSRSLRGRSPVHLNLCGLYAFLTPAYVKNKHSQRQDTTSVTGVLMPNEPMASKVGNHFSKNKSNIPQDKPVEIVKPQEKTESNNTTSSTSNIKENRTAQPTFLQSYSLFIHTPAKSKERISRKRRLAAQLFSNKKLPSTQTNIEMFFKRI